jgi:hypothetical protein
VGDVNRSDCLSVSLDDLGVALHCVVPEADGVIMRTRNNEVALRVDFDIVDLGFVANESEWSHG